VAIRHSGIERLAERLSRIASAFPLSIIEVRAAIHDPGSADGSPVQGSAQS
jgi:hypothetical protein